MTAKIYILLPVHNRREITRGFVECLKQQTFTGYHLVLIDDGSTDGTAEMVQDEIPCVTVLRGNGNWWWAGSLQRALDWLKGAGLEQDTLLLFINDDVRFAPDYLERAIAVMSGKRGSLVLSRFGTAGGGAIIETGICADLRRLSFRIADSADHVNCLSTRGLFAYWGDVRVIGGFHPKLLPHYLSDYEYTIRAHRKGFKCETSAELLIVPNDTTTGYRMLEDKNFPRFLAKYFSRKSVDNPVSWSFFVLLTTRSGWAVPNLIRVWARAAKKIVRALLFSDKTCPR